MRKITAMVFRIMLFLHLVIGGFATPVYQGQLGYIRGETEIAVVDFLDPGFPVAVEIPPTIEGLPVTSVEGFRSSDSVVSIQLPPSIRTIGDDAFSGCRNLQSINFPSGLVQIGEHAFWGCERLAGPIELPEGLTRLGQSAFASSGITRIHLPDSLRHVDYWTFERCLNLVSVRLPARLESLEGYAFYICPSLAAISLPSTLTTIGDGAFFRCVNLAEVEIPETVQYIGEQAFSYCGLRAIPVADGNAAYKSVDGVLFDRNGGTLIQYPQGSPRSDYRVPDGVSTILSVAFAKSIHLKTVSLPTSLRSIKTFAFDGCVQIERVNFARGLIRIEDHAFRECESLKRIHLPDGLEVLDWWAFKDCINLRSAVVPASVRQFWPYTFFGCRSLTALAFEGSPPDLGPLSYPLPDATTIYYSESGGAWPSSFAERPTRLWNPRPLALSAASGVQDGFFGFTLAGASGLIVSIETTTDLDSGNWTSAGTVTLEEGLARFESLSLQTEGAVIYRLIWP